MSAYSEFFLGSTRSVVRLELLEISHPAFLGTYRKVRNSRQPVTVTLETGASATFDYLPARIRLNGVRDDLDAGISVDFGELGDIIGVEIDRIDLFVLNYVRPKVIYREYRSDDLTQPLSGPFTLEIRKIAQNAEGATFEAAAPRLNDSQTGEIYRLDRFPMLRGFL